MPIKFGLILFSLLSLTAAKSNKKGGFGAKKQTTQKIEKTLEVSGFRFDEARIEDLANDSGAVYYERFLHDNPPPVEKRIIDAVQAAKAKLKTAKYDRHLSQQINYLAFWYENPETDVIVSKAEQSPIISEKNYQSTKKSDDFNELNDRWIQIFEKMTAFKDLTRQETLVFERISKTVDPMIVLKKEHDDIEPKCRRFSHLDNTALRSYVLLGKPGA